MTLFTSPREKRLWIYTLIVLIAIISTLVFKFPFVAINHNQNIAVSIFWISFILIGVTSLVHGLRTQPNNIEIAIWSGITSVYLLLFLRLGHPERTHLMEYSVLAVFIHKALIERVNLESQSLKTGLQAFVITFLIGVLDEFVQIFLPSRVFDPLDILFNSLAALLTIGGSMVLQWAKKRFSKIKKH